MGNNNNMNGHLKISPIVGYIKIARIDHWIKNVFVVPGIIAAFMLDPNVNKNIWFNVLIGMISVCIVSSSNYTINEIVDAPYDKFHPTKKYRPVPCGMVNLKIAYIQWLLLGVIGIGLGSLISYQYMIIMFSLWFMGCVYNLKPIRSKDIPYIDILSEAVNNPIRMLAGWYIDSSTTIPPASLMLGYWMLGSYFMATKRFAEFKNIGHAIDIQTYRKSLAYFSEQKLLWVIIFFASSSMLFIGAFIMRYRIELIITVPLISWVMAIYFDLSFNEDSAAQNPEKLYREPLLVIATIVCSAAILILMFVDVQFLRDVFRPTVPLQLKP
jgi:decaprenyl-phosphate phosphoribosyltransferase